MARSTSNSGNTKLKDLRCTRKEIMDTYDSLPPIIRHAYAYAVNNFAPQPAIELLDKGITPETVAMLIGMADQKEISLHKKDQP